MLLLFFCINFRVFNTAAALRLRDWFPKYCYAVLLKNVTLLIMDPLKAMKLKLHQFSRLKSTLFLWKFSKNIRMTCRIWLALRWRYFCQSQQKWLGHVQKKWGRHVLPDWVIFRSAEPKNEQLRLKIVFLLLLMSHLPLSVQNSNSCFLKFSWE